MPKSSTKHQDSKLLTTAEEIQELAAELRRHDIISFDTEFIRESTFFPIVEIIQVATDENSWLVDAQAFKRSSGGGRAAAGAYDLGIQPLLDVFQDRKILKILHAAQGDQECIYTSFNTLATPILDTAIAASLCGYGEGIGLSKLLKSVLDVEIKKGHARTNWSVRPLPSQLIEYAHADVEFLVEAARKLLGELDQQGRREWALQLSSKWEDKSLYEPDIEGTAAKLARGGRLDRRGYSALLELVRWREKRVRELNLPRRWVADDNVLVDLAHVRPKDIEHLSAFRGLNKGEIKNSGAEILAAIRKAGESQEVTLPRMPRPDHPSGEEAQVLDLLRCYIGILADRHRIAARYLATAGQLLPLLRKKIETPKDLIEAGVLSDEAAHLIGEELIAMVHGKRALLVKGTRIEIADISNQEKS